MIFCVAFWYSTNTWDATLFCVPRRMVLDDVFLTFCYHPISGLGMCLPFSTNNHVLVQAATIFIHKCSFTQVWPTVDLVVPIFLELYCLTMTSFYDGIRKYDVKLINTFLATSNQGNPASSCWNWWQESIICWISGMDWSNWIKLCAWQTAWCEFLYITFPFDK